MGVVISDIPLIRKEIFMYQQICDNDGYLRARLMELTAQLSDLRRETGINNVSIKIQGNKSVYKVNDALVLEITSNADTEFVI